MRHLSLALAATLAVSVTPIHAALNDTGQTVCYDASNAVADCATVAADDGDRPRQDARFGRDSAFAAGQLTKTGAGAAGFDFTPLDASGNAIAIAGGVPTTPPACVRDNHTNLIWEVKTDDGGLRDKDWTYSWYDGSTGEADVDDNCFDSARCDTEKYAADVNTANLCGYNSGWRLPTRRELLSIVHYGKATGPLIDEDFFPNTPTGVNAYFVTSDEDASNPPNSAWYVHFEGGDSGVGAKGYPRHVRLVHDGQ